jgi:hypothetical protein
VVEWVCHPSYTRGTNRRIMVQPGSGQNITGSRSFREPTPKKVMITIMRHECKWGTIWGQPERGRVQKGKDTEGWRRQKCIYMYVCVCVRHDIMKAIRVWKRGEEEREWKYNEGPEFVQSTLYTCMQLSQGYQLILLMYTNSKLKAKRIMMISYSRSQQIQTNFSESTNNVTK